ncbi:MAG: PA0069 family radical SAM protein [Deltaproteobacteria bacterium]|nr:PA0069 family radical SAM protein [Deltaproteobacteria bacterium]
MPRPLSNPPNPWRSTVVEYLGEPPPAPLRVHEERARSILSQNESEDVPFRFSLNPYRGCTHACAYCYARPTHGYLDLGAGTDFDSQIVVKVNAPELLRRRFERRSWQGERVAFSGNTDPYQPLEASYELTRRCLEVCLEYRNPVGIITKGALVERDLDLLTALARESHLWIALSIPFHDPHLARALEPGAASIPRRFETIRRLSEAGLEVGVAVAPIIPGLSEPEVPRVLEAARAAGASHAFRIPLRLPREVAPVFLERIAVLGPSRARKIEGAVRELRGGRLNDPDLATRMQGQGPRWRAVEQLFSRTCARLGLETHPHSPETTAFRRPPGPQGELFF